MDKFDRQAEEALPCVISQICINLDAEGGHHECCPAVFRPAIAEKLRANGAEIERLNSAINETLRLADSLNEMAGRGAGFVEHWGERVMQAVRALRDVNAFAGETLQHNRWLLEANGEFRAERDAALAEVERLKADRDMWIQDDAKQNTNLGFAIAERDKLRAQLEAAEKKVTSLQAQLDEPVKVSFYECEACKSIQRVELYRPVGQAARDAFIEGMEAVNVLVKANGCSRKDCYFTDDLIESIQSAIEAKHKGEG